MSVSQMRLFSQERVYININFLSNEMNDYLSTYVYIIKNKTDPLRAVRILMRKGMGHTTVSAT